MNHSGHTTHPESAETLIEASGLSKVFDPGKSSEVKAVLGVNLSVRRGEIVLVMGPSGSGKTTLVTLLGGLSHPTAGTVRVAGLEFSELTESTLPQFRRENVGFVFQSFHLLQSLTALQNVEIAYRLAGHRRPEARDKAKGILERLGLGKRFLSYPKQLSGGEKQRVSVARALAGDPKVIFADEPTANLDSKSGHDVMRLLCGIACEEHRTVVIVSHDQRLRDMAMRVIWMEDGKLTREEPGNHASWCTMPHEHR